MVIYESKDVLAEFLTAEMEDPRGRLTAETLTKSADGSTAVFDLDTNVKTRAVTKVKVDSEVLNKWQHYKPDIRGQKLHITKYTAAELSGKEVTIEVKKGETTWIYPDMPRKDLSKDSYPRIGMAEVENPGQKLGTYKADNEYTTTFRVDSFAYENQVHELGKDDRPYEGSRLAKTILSLLHRKFEYDSGSWTDEKSTWPMLRNVATLTGPTNTTFDKEREAFRSRSEVALKRLSIGKDE